MVVLNNNQQGLFQGPNFVVVNPNPNPNPGPNDLAFRVEVLSPPPPTIVLNPDQDILDSIGSTKIISQNMNSTNMSALTQISDENKFHEKVNALIKQKSNIFLMQDIRLGNHSDKFKNQLLQNKFGNFDCYLNSSKTERGTGILIRRGQNIKVHKHHLSRCENAQLLEISLNDIPFLIVNVY